MAKLQSIKNWAIENGLEVDESKNLEGVIYIHLSDDESVKISDRKNNRYYSINGMKGKGAGIELSWKGQYDCYNRGFRYPTQKKVIEELESEMGVK